MASLIATLLTMTDFSQPSSGLLSEWDSGQHYIDDLESQDEGSVVRNVNVGNTFALMRAVVELRVLQTTTAILRFTRTNPVSISDPDSSIRRAIDRREQRISRLIDAMTKDDFEKSVGEIASRMEIPAPPVPQRILSPSEMLEELTIEEQVSHEEDQMFLCAPVSADSIRSTVSTASDASTPKLNTLISDDPIPIVDENIRGRTEGTLSEDDRRASGSMASSGPTPGTESSYSSLGRSLSVSNMNSVTSIPRQYKIVSAAQYTKIIAERQPQFSFLNYPYSIDSLVAEGPRLDRSALELDEHANEYKRMSADSFPGEFPVSEGLEYSSLATAKHHTRIPSIRTSVRPFSDL
ncbi:predicted protein [Aspergillus nidulans FGSC A4]|jgi:hypothetical protein|uniref:Uncharacterized protein n=1 Tax=Emericella nidulans (strain FGSC A4 / ATCC 38163 / CBS 112.46 / NRRL 194 / M139) TaxID=227321 RepID=Q5BBY4_EMENI|nr:hypothetical protein [Aspergillus nidulans FGSC A4]EAA65111.1 predicted protein [Aspergillus nidulans FGSC A4]CBF85874.1 TPA: conserved hypothetical protein [Aspergillus nidulans FGSC A4]|eukprot:XP_659550.1 predicted protein [Aspergillus nidulans FGSC A4]